MIRIKQGHFYVLRTHPGISGFQRANEWVETIVSDKKARLNKEVVDREYLVKGQGIFRLCDGHLPDYQPRVAEREALDWLRANPFSGVVIVA